MNIIKFEGKNYYQVKPHEKIKRNALHSFSPNEASKHIKHESTIGMTPSQFHTDKCFFNPAIKQLPHQTKQKFNIKNLYNSIVKKDYQSNGSYSNNRTQRKTIL